MPLSFYETKEKRPPPGFYPEEQKKGGLTFYPERTGKPSLEELAEEWQTREEFERKAQEAGYVEKEPSDPLISLRHIPEHFRRKPEPAPITDIPIEELTQLIPKPSPADPLSLAIEGLRRFQARAPIIGPGEPEVREPMMFQAPPEEETGLVEANLQSLLRLLKFPVTAGLEAAETFVPRAEAKGIWKYIPKPTKQTVRWVKEMAIGIGLAPIELLYTFEQLADPTKPTIDVIGRGEMPREVIAREILETIPEQAIKLMIGQGMLKGVGKVTKGARLGWKGMPTEPAAEPILPLAEEAALRPLAELAETERGVKTAKMADAITEAMKPEGEYIRWWKEQLEAPPERLRRGPAEAELLKRKLRALEEKPSVFEKRKPKEPVPGEAELKLRRELEPKLEEVRAEEPWEGLFESQMEGVVPGVKKPAKVPKIDLTPRMEFKAEKYWEQTPMDLQGKWDDAITHITQVEEAIKPQIKSLQDRLQALKEKRDKASNTEKRQIKEEIKDLKAGPELLRASYEESFTDALIEVTRQAEKRAKELGVPEEKLEQFSEDFSLNISMERPYIERNYKIKVHELFDEVVSEFLPEGKPKPAPMPKAVKEPWEMTREEYTKSIGKKPKEIIRRTWTPESLHGREIKEALSLGKPVPPEVLAEYPELAKAKPPPIAKEFEPIVKKTVTGKEGKESPLILAGEGGKPQRVSSKFKVVEVKDLEPSHNIDFTRNPKYPEGLQERPYHTDKAEQMKVLNNTKEFIPEFLVNTNPDAISGAPVVSGDGIVFGGNSRVMSSKLLYKEGRGAILKDYIIDNAEQFGLNPAEVLSMKEPILVREVPSPKTQAEATTLIRRFNESFTQQLTANAEALAKAKLLSPETIESLVARLGPEESLAEFLSNVKSRGFLKALSKEGIIDRRNVGRYVNTETGLLNEAGKELIGRLLTAKVITQPEVLEALPKTFLNKVSTVVPSILKTQINPKFDLAPIVQKIAKAEIGKHASPLKTIDEYLAQRDMFVPPEVTTDYFAIKLWRFIDESGVKKMRDAFKKYAKIVEQQGTPSQRGFGFVKPLSKTEIFETAFRPPKEPISEAKRIKKRREFELHAGIPIRPIKMANEIIRFMDDVAAKYISKPLHQRIINWIEDKAPVSLQDWWNKWAKTLYKADPELATFMRRFRGGMEYRKLAVRKAGAPLMVKEGEPLTTVFGRPFKEEVIKRRLGQLIAPTTVRPGRQPRAKFFPARPARKLSELVEMTPETLIETKRRVGKTMTPSEAEGILEYAKQQQKELAKRGIKEEIPLPEAGISPVPKLKEAVMGARIVEAELGKSLYDLGLLSRSAFKEFYGIHLKRMYESVELAREQRPRVPGLRMGPAKRLRLKMLTQRGKTAVEAEQARWTKQAQKTQKQLSQIKIEGIKGLGKHFIWRLKDAGYGTLDKLISASPEALMENVKGLGKGRAASFKTQAERFLAETKPQLLKDLRQQRSMKKYARMRVDLPSEWQKEAGRYMTPEKPFLKGSYATLYNIQTGKLLKDIGAPKFKGKFWDEIESAKFSERIPDTKELGKFVYGDLAGKYVSKKVLGEIKPFLELPSETNRALNAWLGLWKMGKVAGSFGTQIRNIYFNVGPLSDFARVGLKDYFEGCKEYKKRGDHYETLLKEGYLETDYFKAEVEVAFRSLSRLKEENMAVAGAQFTKDLMGKLGFNKAVKVYQTVDQIHKMAVYGRNIRAGLSKAEALKETYKWSQNYREVPQMADYLRTHATGFVAPFLTFSFEAARFLKNAAIERPVTLTKWVTAPFLLRAWAQKRSGLSDKEMNQLIKSLPKDRSLYSSLLVPRKEKGKFHLVDLSYTFPWMDIYSKVEKPWDIALGSPVFKTMMELYTGIDSWTEKPVEKPEDTNSIDVIKRWADHLYRQMMPSTAPEIPGLTEGGYEWRRIARVLKGKKTYYGEEYPTLPALIHTFGGVPIREFDLKRELGWKKREIDKKIGELKRRRSALKYNRGLTTKQKLRLWHKLTGRMKELSQERVDLMTGK